MGDKYAEGSRLVSTYAKWAAGAALVPVPLVDMVAITGLQIKMITDLAEHYDTPFRQEWVRGSLAALTSGIGSTKLAYGLGASLLKVVPVIGSYGAMITLPALAAATTYAVGQVFLQHFESGGTLLTFNAKNMRAHFEREFSARAADQTQGQPLAEAASPVA